MYTPGAIVNSQRTPTKINKNGAILKVEISVEQVLRHLKTFTIMKRQFYFLSYVDDILVVCKCIQINFLIFTFVSNCFFKSLWQRETQVSFS